MSSISSLRLITNRCPAKAPAINKDIMGEIFAATHRPIAQLNLKYSHVQDI